MKVAIFLANGFEEIEGLTVVDMLRRARIDIDMVSISDTTEIVGSHGIRIGADTVIEEIDFDDYGMLVLPGGLPGTNYLKDCKLLGEKLKAFAEAGKYVAAICAAPSVLGGLGILEGKWATCYPGFEDKLTGAVPQTIPVVVCGNVITSRGMGTAIEFAGELIAVIKGRTEAEEIKKSIIYNV